MKLHDEEDLEDLPTEEIRGYQDRALGQFDRSKAKEAKARKAVQDASQEAEKQRTKRPRPQEQLGLIQNAWLKWGEGKDWPEIHREWKKGQSF